MGSIQFGLDYYIIYYRDCKGSVVLSAFFAENSGTSQIYQLYAILVSIQQTAAHTIVYAAVYILFLLCDLQDHLFAAP